MFTNGQTQGNLRNVICKSNTCTAVGDFTDNNSGVSAPLAYISNNGGNNWLLSSAFSLPSGQTQGSLSSVTCITNICTAIGYSFNNSFSNYLPLAYTSSNSGADWTLSPAIPLPNGQSEGTLTSITCLGSLCTSVGYANNISFNTLPLAYTSRDSGIHWTLASVFSQPNGQTQGLLYGVGSGL